MIPIELGLFLILAIIVIGFLYCKMMLIWKDAMLKKSEQIKKDMKRLKELKEIINN